MLRAVAHLNRRRPLGRYRSPELTCAYFIKHSPGIDIWAVGCVFAEVTH